MISVSPKAGSSGEVVQLTKLAPLALFVYNRPEHTRRTVEALQHNELAQRSDLFVFADGPRDERMLPAIEQVRTLARAITGFRSVTVVERDRNLGLSKSIISGVTQLCQEFGRAIVIEDDIVTAPDFLKFVNSALDRYEKEPAVFSVCGFVYPIVAPPSYPYDAFFSYRFACWGWGTWRDRWEKADWSVSDFPQFRADRERQKRFDRAGNDCSHMLALHVAGKIDSWDTVWAYTHSKHNAAALLPVISKTYNVGLDGSGTHCSRPPFAQASLGSRTDLAYRFPERVEFDPRFAAEVRRVCSVSLLKRAAKHVLRTLGLR